MSPAHMEDTHMIDRTTEIAYIVASRGTLAGFAYNRNELDISAEWEQPPWTDPLAEPRRAAWWHPEEVALDDVPPDHPCLVVEPEAEPVALDENLTVAWADALADIIEAEENARIARRREEASTGWRPRRRKAARKAARKPRRSQAAIEASEYVARAAAPGLPPHIVAALIKHNTGRLARQGGRR